MGKIKIFSTSIYLVPPESGNSLSSEQTYEPKEMDYLLTYAKVKSTGHKESDASEQFDFKRKENDLDREIMSQ